MNGFSWLLLLYKGHVYYISVGYPLTLSSHWLMFYRYPRSKDSISMITGGGGGGNGSRSQVRAPLGEGRVVEWAEIFRGDVEIPRSRMTKTCWETLVTCL